MIKKYKLTILLIFCIAVITFSSAVYAQVGDPLLTNQKKVIYSGQTLSLYEGYSLVLVGIDYSAKKVALNLYKDGQRVDSGIIGSKETYEYKKDINRREITILTAYIQEIYTDSVVLNPVSQYSEGTVSTPTPTPTLTQTLPQPSQTPTSYTPTGTAISITSNIGHKAATYPHLETEYKLSTNSVTKYSDTISIDYKIKGLGGKFEELPEAIRNKMPRKPLDVVLVIDKSGSMEADDYSPNRLIAAQTAAKSFVSLIGDNDRVAVVSFTGYTKIESDFSNNKESLYSSIDNIYPVWEGTAIGDGLIKGINLLNDYGQKDAVKAIVLLSDGASNRGTSVSVASSRSKDAGIPVFTIGIGSKEGSYVKGQLQEFDEQALIDISVETGGKYYFAADKSDLINIYKRLSSTVLNVAGLDVKVNIEPSEYFDLKSENYKKIDNIQIDDVKVLNIKGNLKKATPPGKIPLIRITVSYVLLTDKDNQIEYIRDGLIYINYDIKPEKSNIKINNINFDNNENEYKKLNVYRTNNLIEVDVDLDNPANQHVFSMPVIYPTYTTNPSSVIFRDEMKQTDKESVSHSFEVTDIGEYTFSEYLYYPDASVLTDYKTTDLYVIFDKNENIDDLWYDGEKVETTHFEYEPEKINPKSKEILDLTLSNIGQTKEKLHAVEEIVDYLKNHIEYSASDNDWKDDFTALDTNGKNPKSGMTGKPVGDCSDYALAFISMARSVGIPARPVLANYKDGGHAFAEFYIDGEWVHVEPQGYVNKPDIYLEHEEMEFYTEVKNKVKPDTYLTMRYSVGLTEPSNTKVITITKKSTNDVPLVFTNKAKNNKKYIAKNFKIEVINNGGLDIEVSESEERNFKPGKEFQTNLIIEIPETMNKIGITDVVLKVEYETIDGDQISKTYPFVVILKERE